MRSEHLNSSRITAFTSIQILVFRLGSKNLNALFIERSQFFTGNSQFSMNRSESLFGSKTKIKKHFFLNNSFHCCIIVWTDSLLVYNLLTISLTSSRVKRLSCPFTSHCLPWVKSDVNHDYSFVFVRVLLLLHYASFSHVFLNISFLMTKLLPFTVKSCGNRIDWFIC